MSDQVGAATAGGKVKALPVTRRKGQAPAVGSIAKARFRDWLNGPDGVEWRRVRDERLRAAREGDCDDDVTGGLALDGLAPTPLDGLTPTPVV